MALIPCATARADNRYTCQPEEGPEIDLIVTDTQIIQISHPDSGLPPSTAHFEILKRYSDADGSEIIEATDGNPIKDPYSYFMRFNSETLDLYLADDLDWDMEQEKILHYRCVPISGAASG